MSKTFKDTPQAKDRHAITEYVEEYNDYDELVVVPVRDSYTFRNITVTEL